MFTGCNLSDRIVMRLHGCADYVNGQCSSGLAYRGEFAHMLSADGKHILSQQLTGPQGRLLPRDVEIVTLACVIQSVANWSCEVINTSLYRLNSMINGKPYQRYYRNDAKDWSKQEATQISQEAIGVSGLDYWLTKVAVMTPPSLATEQAVLDSLERR